MPCSIPSGAVLTKTDSGKGSRIKSYPTWEDFTNQFCDSGRSLRIQHHTLQA